MEPTTWIALGALVVSALGITFQSYKFIQDLRERARRSSEDATKAGAERDSIAVKTAEGTLLIMKGMLDVTKASESELRQRVTELEESDRQKDREIRELKETLEERDRALHREREEYAEAQVLFEKRVREVAAEYEKKLQELQQRMEVLEARSNGNGNDQETNPR